MNLLNSGLNFTFNRFFEVVKDLFLNFKPKDAIEIVLLACFFTIAFKFLRGKKAGALLIGIGICLSVLAISIIFEFNALYSVFSGIANSGAIFIIILFQPELREALERIGSGSINGILSFSDHKKKKELYFSIIESICSAVRELSEDSTGALIVVEKNTRISDVVSSGTKLNADVSSSLLRNIFFNRAPLHDGAVIITDGRLTAAGCLLPLTRRTDIDSDLGTRHRAAIGMSETSDAITVVVSEETGAISVAYDCTLMRNMTPEALRIFLLENLLKKYDGSN